MPAPAPTDIGPGAERAPEALAGYRPELDGLRSVAVYLVLFFHAGMAAFGGGFVGVDLFFVLSGFLVSQVILREIDRTGGFRLGWFYARRVRRLLPAAVVVVALTAALQVLTTAQPLRLELVDDARAALLYYANWHFVVESRDYFAEAGEASPFLHFWSLSIEEQFYVALPVVVLLVHRVARRPARALAIVAGTATVVSVALQVWRARTDATYAYYGTDTRLYQLTAGILLALVARELVRRRTAVARTGTWLAPAGLVAIVLVGSGALEVSASVRGLLATAASLAVVGGLWAAPRGVTARALALPAPRYLGQISYGTYLWHWPVLVALREVFDVRPLVLAALTAVLATALAALSYQLLETPLRRARAPRLGEWPVVATGLAVSVLAAVLVVPTLLEADRRPALTADSGRSSGAVGNPRLDRPVPAGLDLAAAKADVPERVDPCTPDAPEVCTTVQGDGPHVLLVGDSQAQMFVTAFEELARDHDLTLSVSALPGCMWQAGLQNERATSDEQEVCRAARDDFYADTLPDLGVDVVVAVSMAHSAPRWESDLSAPGGPSGETLDERLARTTEETAALVRDAGAEVVLVRSLLGTEGFDIDGFDPIECLATAVRLADCGVVAPLERPVLDGVYDALALSDPGVATVDLNPIICVGGPVCLPVVGDQVVWKDRDHVTSTFLVERRDRIWARLEATAYVG